MNTANYVQGEYSQTLYHSDTSGYTIALFKVKKASGEEFEEFLYRTITITGYFPEFGKDEIYKVYGDLIIHPKYGKQVGVKSYERVVANDSLSLVKYLSGGLFPGIGEKTAESIVETLGNDAIQLIMEDYNHLLSVPKMTQKKAVKIAETIKLYEGSQTIVLELTKLGFTLKMAMKIYKKYDYQTLELIRSNPYQLIESMDGLGFVLVDEIALKNGVEPTDKKRLGAALLYTLTTICFNEGHTYLTKSQLIQSTLDELKDEIITYNKLEEALHFLVSKEKIIVEDQCYYTPPLFFADHGIVVRLRQLSQLENTNEFKIDKIHNIIEYFEKEDGIEYAQKQKEAIVSAMQNKIMILTGGPGTGKTTTINGIVKVYSRLNNINPFTLKESNDIALVAPSGRAAKRISETSKVSASTIHRFLKWNKETNEFVFNEDNQVSCKLLIIDEASMVDTWLLNHLLKALRTDVRIIFVGDNNQLPSVSPGEVLRDLIDSDCFKTVQLDVLYRQSQHSTIVDLAHKVKDGQVPSDLMVQQKDRNFIPCNAESIVQVITEVTEKAIKKGFNYDNFQVLVPMYRGVAGIDALNKALQEVFNPKEIQKRELKFGDIVYREGDKILHLVNNPNENVFNGDIGILQKIELPSENEDRVNAIYVEYDDNRVRYTPQDFNNITHAYAMSVHKSQGSEFKLVIMPVVRSYYRMLQRKLIYTGITRAKESLLLLGEPNAFIEGVTKEDSTIRQTNLKNKLIKEIKGISIEPIYSLDELGEIGMENISPYDFMD